MALFVGIQHHFKILKQYEVEAVKFQSYLSRFIELKKRAKSWHMN